MEIPGIVNNLKTAILGRNTENVQSSIDWLSPVHERSSCQLSHDMTKPTKWECAQRILRSAWADAQADLSLPAGRTVTLLVLSWGSSIEASWYTPEKNKTEFIAFLSTSLRTLLAIMLQILCHEKLGLRESLTRQNTNWPAQLQRPARILKFRIYKLEVSFCLGSEQ